MYNRVIQGDCAAVLKTLPSEIVDFVLSDPPYFVGYRDRSGRTIRNDHYPGQILDAFNDVYRLLKPNSLCVSFYGWNRVDSFFSAWKGAGFMPVGHLVFNKTYASAQRFLRYSHESAYVLAKGRPELPANPLTDVLPWHYSGNHNHPTEKSVNTIRPIIEAFTKAGDVVLDPFAGSGSSLVAAALLRRQYIGVELEQKYCEHARRRIAGVARYLSIPRRDPKRAEGVGGAAGRVPISMNGPRNGPA